MSPILASGTTSRAASKRDFRAPVRHLIGDFFFRVDVGAAGLAVDDGRDVLGAGRVDITPVGAHKRRGQRFQDHFTRQVALTADLIKGEKELTLHRYFSRSLKIQNKSYEQEKWGSPTFRKDCLD